MDQNVYSRHCGIIDGLSSLYDTLVQMQYLEAADVIRPPHPQGIVDTVRLQQLGLDPEAIQLASLLPALRNEVVWAYDAERGTQVAPRSKAVNYFVQSPGTAGDQLQDHLSLADTINDGNAPRLPPWLLRLSFGGITGINLIYNVRESKVIPWFTRLSNSRTEPLQRQSPSGRPSKGPTVTTSPADQQLPYWPPCMHTSPR